MSLECWSKMIFLIVATLTAVAAVRSLCQETNLEHKAVYEYLSKSYNAPVFFGILVLPFYDLLIFSWGQATQENREKTCSFFLQFFACLIPNVPYAMCTF